MNIAVIPARGGSKRIPRKNIKMFNGKPMIAYAIEAAKTSGLFEHIVVSTDDEEIAKISQEYGAEVPFMRPNVLADDYSGTAPVIAHAIDFLQSSRVWDIEYVCCIYACVPFIQIEDLEDAFDLLCRNNASYSFPVSEFPSAVQRAMRRLVDGRMQPMYPECEQMRTQDLEPAYFDAGQFYWGKSKEWLFNKSIHSNGVGLPIPYSRVIDIDTHDDWKRAEMLMQHM